MTVLLHPEELYLILFGLTTAKLSPIPVIDTRLLIFDSLLKELIYVTL